MVVHHRGDTNHSPLRMSSDTYIHTDGWVDGLLEHPVYREQHHLVIILHQEVPITADYRTVLYVYHNPIGMATNAYIHMVGSLDYWNTLEIRRATASCDYTPSGSTYR